MMYSDLFRNEHFLNLAAIIRVAYTSEQWREQHPQVSFWSLIDNLSAAVYADAPMDKVVVMCCMTTLLVELTTADRHLRYSELDVRWLVEQLDSPQARAVMSLLLAYASAPTDLYTPNEIASMTGTAESTWRNKAARGEVPGAVKKGKQWLIPGGWLKSQGIAIN